jgi:hypothetical protein
MSASWLRSDVSAKVLNSTEGTHIENMSTFEADQHLQALTPSQYSTPGDPLSFDDAKEVS